MAKILTTKNAKTWLPEQSSKWPRTTRLTGHSPIFYTENKDRFLRQLLIRDIQEITGRPLVVYFASPHFRSEVRNDDIKRIQEVIAPFSGMEIDLLLETDGGDPDAAEGIVSMIKAIVPSFRAVVPIRAKSSGTLICLAADSILMGPSSELGPIEPQLNGAPASIVSKSKTPTIAEYAAHTLRQTAQVAEKLLKEGMMKEFSHNEIKNTVAELSTRKSYLSHGAVIDHRDAKALKLKVEYLTVDDELWKRLFLLHCFYDFDSSARCASKFFEQEMFSSTVIGDEGPSLRDG